MTTRISFLKWHTGSIPVKKNRRQSFQKGWNVNKLDVKKLLLTLNKREVLCDVSETGTKVIMSRKAKKIVEKTMRLITQAKSTSMPRRTGKKKSAHVLVDRRDIWTEEGIPAIKAEIL